MDLKTNIAMSKAKIDCANIFTHHNNLRRYAHSRVDPIRLAKIPLADLVRAASQLSAESGGADFWPDRAACCPDDYVDCAGTDFAKQKSA